MKRVLVVSHADADGHVIAEQVRRNLETVTSFDVTTLVDPQRTKDHKTWLHLDRITEIDSHELVFFVDLMFAPASFAAEADALVAFVGERPRQKFFLMDHHPLPLRRLSRAANLRAVYRPDVYDCTFGPPTELMILAALNENQPTRVGAFKKDVHDLRAKGLRRAAALGGALAGEKLSVLLRFDRWKELEALALEPKEMHQLPRGRRRATDRPSQALRQLNQTATQLLQQSAARTARHHRAGSPMSYDFDTATDRKPPKAKAPRASGSDLEAIITLLELAAIYLTTEPGAEFSRDDLIKEARAIGGKEIEIDEKDIDIVLSKSGFLKKSGKRLRLK